MREINRFQTNIMIFVKTWAKTHDVPISQKQIIKTMQENGVGCYKTTVFAINSLIKKGYLRKAYSPQANKTFYVMIRNISESAEYDFSQFKK